MKILVVDNDEGLRDYLAMIIETGFECDLMEAGSGDEAIETLKNNPDTRLVISEIDMPGGGAQAIFDYTSQQEEPYPIICLTAKPKDDPVVSLIIDHDGYNGYSPKPFKDAELFPLVEHALNAPYHLRQLNQAGSSSGSSAPAPTHSRSDDDWHYGQQGKKSQQAEGDADWSIDKRKPGQGEGDADWSIDKRKPGEGEGDADWSIDKRKPGQGEGDADWGIDGRKPGQGEGDADWGIDGRKPGQGEGDADWSIDKKTPGQGEATGESNVQQQPIRYRDPSKVSEEEEDQEVEDHRYVKVKIKRFLNFNKLPSSVFLRLSPKKFVKIIEKNDLYESDIITKYAGRNIESLYLLREEYEAFNEAFSNLIMASLKNANLSGEQRAVGELVAYTHILEQAKRIGISDAVANQAKQTIENSIAQMKQDTALSSLLDSIMRGQDFISEHSLFLTYICQSICSQTSWGSHATYQKLSMAALLHDVTLKKPEYAKIEHKDSDLFKNLSRKEKEHVLAHPDESASLAASGGNLYADIENIIVQHHEQPDGTGFPRGLSPIRISPLSCIFIIAQEYMHAVIKPDVTDEEIKAAIEHIKEKYPRGNFKKPLQGFIKAFDKS